MDVIDEKQHEIVENMSNLVKRLKENAVNSRQIIRKDIQVTPYLSIFNLFFFSKCSFLKQIDYQ